MTGCTTTADAPTSEAGHCPLDRGVKPLRCCLCGQEGHEAKRKEKHESGLR